MPTIEEIYRKDILQDMQKLIVCAKEYRIGARESIYRNKHMNNVDHVAEVEPYVVDAVLVDFINFIAMKQGMDLGLYTKDLW